MSEETELLRLILREPETGLEEAMRRYAPFVKAAAGRVLPGAPQEVEECMADTFIALWKNAGTLLDRQIPPKAWLAVTARNKALNRLRVLRRQNALPLDETLLPAWLKPARWPKTRPGRPARRQLPGWPHSRRPMMRSLCENIICCSPAVKLQPRLA